MKPELYLLILYKLTIIEKLLEKETDIFKQTRYKAIQETLLFILEEESKL